jgi:hypothetical protein
LKSEKLFNKFFYFQLEGEAQGFSRQVMEMLEDRRRDCNDNAEEIKQLHERVKYNYDRLDALNDIPLRVKHFSVSLFKHFIRPRHTRYK